MSLLLDVVMYNRNFVRFGGVKCAIYLTTLLHNHQRWTTSDGWMLLQIESISAITGLDADEQEESRASLCGLGILRTGMAFDDPAMCLDLNKLTNLLGDDDS